MKIGIDARGITWYHGTGIGTYTENLLRNMLAIDNINKYHIYWSGNKYNDFIKKNSKIIMTSKRHHRFFQVNYFPNNLNYENVDIYHIPQNGIGLNESINCKKVVTIHDLIPYVLPETVGKGYLIKFLKEMPYIIENSDAILTVSEFSKKDILRFFPIDPDKIHVTHLAADDIFCPLNNYICKSIIKEKYNITDPFILYLGGFSDRKNVHSLIEAFSKVYSDLDKPYKLVILGSYKDSSQKLLKLADKLNISQNTIFAGFIPDNELPLFYNACECFVYPSKYEGFGLPPLEAMSCAAPVITSDITSIPEVVKDSALLINPFNISSIVTALGDLLSDENLRDKLSRKGYQQSKNFSWKKTALKTLEVYKSIANE